LLGLACKWGAETGASNAGLLRALAVLTSEPARVLGSALGTLQASAGQLVQGGVADVCIFNPTSRWVVESAALRSQGKHTPFSGYELPARVCWTLVGGQVAYEAHPL
jgi:dihydroorotase